MEINPQVILMFQLTEKALKNILLQMFKLYIENDRKHQQITGIYNKLLSRNSKLKIVITKIKNSIDR